MATDEQAKAAEETETTVADPLDAANIPNSGTTTTLSDYEDQVRAAMEQEEVKDPQELEQSAIEEEDEVLPDADEANEESFEEDEDEDEPELKTSKRIRLSDPEEIAIHAIKRAKGCTLVEATRYYLGEQPQARATESTQEQESAPSENLASIEAEIEELYEQKDAAIRAIDVDTQADLDKQIRQLKKKASVLAVTEAEQSARAAHTQLEQAQQDFDTTWDFSRNRYPELNDPNSAMYKEVARLDAEMQELGDPLATDPKRLWDLAKRAGLNTRTPMTKPQGKQSSAPARGKTGSPVQPASGNRSTTTTDPSKRAAEVIAGMKTADDYERIVASLG